MARGGGFGNPAQSYYRALALLKLGQADQAKAVFQQLVASGRDALRVETPGGATTFASVQQARQRQRHRSEPFGC
jgi:hypothetical protein